MSKCGLCGQDSDDGTLLGAVYACASCQAKLAQEATTVEPVLVCQDCPEWEACKGDALVPVFFCGEKCSGIFQTTAQGFRCSSCSKVIGNTIVIDGVRCFPLDDNPSIIERLGFYCRRFRKPATYARKWRLSDYRQWLKRLRYLREAFQRGVIEPRT